MPITRGLPGPRHPAEPIDPVSLECEVAVVPTFLMGRGRLSGRPPRQATVPLLLRSKAHRPSTFGCLWESSQTSATRFKSRPSGDNRGRLYLKPALQQGGCNWIKTSLDPVGLISNQHQPGLIEGLEAASRKTTGPTSKTSRTSAEVHNGS